MPIAMTQSTKSNNFSLISISNSSLMLQSQLFTKNLQFFQLFTFNNKSAIMFINARVFDLPSLFQSRDTELLQFIFYHYFVGVNLALDLIFGISKCRPLVTKELQRFVVGPQRIIMCARSVSQECLPGQDPYISRRNRARDGSTGVGDSFFI